MQLLYVDGDQHYLEKRGMRTLFWLDDVGAVPIEEANPKEEAYLFSYARSIGDYAKLVDSLPLARDRPEDRALLVHLEATLDRLAAIGATIVTPKTWRIDVDEALPEDLSFPVFLRTPEQSWKTGGHSSRVTSAKEFAEEAELFRKVFGRDVPILAREWLELAPAGESLYGTVPQEIRTWSVDHEPVAWSFHHLHATPEPRGFPPADKEIEQLGTSAAIVASAFNARLVVADFAKTVAGDWVFLEAGPGSCAGTAHEQVFKAVALRLLGKATDFCGDSVGGAFPTYHSSQTTP